MSTYIITNKATGAEVTRYAAAAPVEQLGELSVPFSEFDHTVFDPLAPEVAPTSMTWTKLEYLRRFTQDERIAIRAAATQSPQLTDYLELLALAEDVTSTDPDIVGALAMLEGAGLIGAGRAGEILNG
jgi:hypothetical protein